MRQVLAGPPSSCPAGRSLNLQDVVAPWAAGSASRGLLGGCLVGSDGRAGFGAALAPDGSLPESPDSGNGKRRVTSLASRGVQLCAVPMRWRPSVNGWKPLNCEFPPEALFAKENTRVGVLLSAPSFHALCPPHHAPEGVCC